MHVSFRAESSGRSLLWHMASGGVLRLFIFCFLLPCGCVSQSDDAQLNEIDGVSADQQPGLSDAERAEYQEDGFEFEDGLANPAGSVSDEKEPPRKRADLDLPTELERVDIHRFLLDRRTLTAPYEPVDVKYRQFIQSFEPDIRLSPDASRELKVKILESVAQHHWIFVEGLYQFQADVTDASGAELRERKKRVIVHHLKALTFLAQVLDEQMSGARYRKIVRELYRIMADRHLMRPVRERPQQR
jgi:hypothetical protein